MYANLSDKLHSNGKGKNHGGFHIYNPIYIALGRLCVCKQSYITYYFRHHYVYVCGLFGVFY